MQTYGDMTQTFAESVVRMGELLVLVFSLTGFILLGTGIYFLVTKLSTTTNRGIDSFPGAYAVILFLTVGTFLLSLAGFVYASIGSFGLQPGTGIDF